MTNESAERRDNLRSVAAVSAGVAAVAISFALIVAIFWIASEAFIIIFAGILLAVLLDAGARGLGRIVRWPRRARVAIVFVVATLLILASLSLGGAILVSQANNFLSAMKGLFAQLNDFVHSGGLGLFPKGSDLSMLLPRVSVLFGGATTIAATAMDMLVMGVAIPFLGGFFAWEPEAYKAIVLSILPKAKRARVDAVLDLSAHTMREWLVGQSVSMAVIFLFSLAALMFAGMPYAALLAVQAGLLTFIPTLGPFVAGVVIILAGLSQSVVMAAYGLGAYLVIQLLETQLVTPLIQERTVRLPPAMTLALQILAGVLFGLLGVVFVVPAAAAAKALIAQLYVEDYLGGGWRVEDSADRRPSRLNKWLNRMLGTRNGT